MCAAVDASTLNPRLTGKAWPVECSLDLQLEGASTATGLGSLAKGEWKKYGPYPVEVRDGVLDMALVARVGTPHVMGIEISR